MIIIVFIMIAIIMVNQDHHHCFWSVLVVHLINHQSSIIVIVFFMITIILVNHDHHRLLHCGQSWPSSLLLVSVGSLSHRPLPDNQSQLYLLNHHVLLPHISSSSLHLVLILQENYHNTLILISPSSHPCNQSPILSLYVVRFPGPFCFTFLFLF